MKKRQLFPYSLRRTVLWICFYSLMALSVWGIVNFARQDLSDSSGSIEGQVVLSTDQQRYEVGDEVVFTINNDSASKIFITNDCPQEPLIVYRWNNDMWQRIHEKAPLGSCADQARQVAIDSYDSLSGSYKNWQKLFEEPGIYRIAVVVNGYDGLAFRDIEILQPITTADETAPATQPTLEQQTIEIEDGHDADDANHEEFEPNEGSEVEFEND